MSSTKVGHCLVIVSGLVLFDVNGFSSTLTIDGTDDIYAAAIVLYPLQFSWNFPVSETFPAG